MSAQSQLFSLWPSAVPCTHYTREPIKLALGVARHHFAIVTASAVANLRILAARYRIWGR